MEDDFGCKSHERIYLTLKYPKAIPGSKTLLTGLRMYEDLLYITGFYEPPSNSEDPVVTFLYVGNEIGNGNWYILSYPSDEDRTVVSTNLYGPMVIDADHVRIVGNYTTEETGSRALGCMYEGHINGSGKWTTLTPSIDAINTIAHSTMGNLVVGNYDTRLIQGKAFIYNVLKKRYYEIIKPEAKSITAYGIWHNKGDHYTICGGFSNLDKSSGLGSAYLVDWDNHRKILSNWRQYEYKNNKRRAKVTHFNGISAAKCGGYNLTGDAVLRENTIAFFAYINKNAEWEKIKVPCSNVTSGNSVAQDIVIGVYSFASSSTVKGYISLVI